ncbi:MAG: DNA polymerase I [Planctomycetaceae bacterium]|jgi:DNA polymerase-1|nr:DNA polymerase I [Planctomycetaceae bacterium]
MSSDGNHHDAVWVLDAHGILYQVFHALPSDMSSARGEPVGAIFGFVRDLLTLFNEHHPSSLLCAFDMPGTTFRHEIDVNYKANRKAMPEPLSMQIRLIHPVLEAFGIPAFGVPTFEADDLMASIAAKAEAAGKNCVLVTADKDCRQLITSHVSLFNLRKQAFYQAANLLEDWGIRPDQVVDFQAMVGDSTDNVPGIPLIGPKLATELLQKYETLENVLAHADEVSGQKRKENLKNGRDAAMMCRELVRLRQDVPLEVSWEAGRVQGFDGELLRAMCRRFNFKSLLPRMEKLEQTFGTRRIDKAALREETQEMFYGDSRNITKDAQAEEPDDALPLFALSAVVSHPPQVNKQTTLFHDESEELVAAKVSAKYRLVNDEITFQEFLAALQSHLQKNSEQGFSFDLETTALRYVDAQIVGMSFCWQKDEAWYIAVRAPLGEPTLKQERVFAEIQPILEDAAVGKIGQNVKYDMLILRKFGVRLAGVRFDTMLADYLLHAGEQRHNLDELAERYLKHTTIKIDELIGSGKNQRRMNEAPSSLVADYAAEDALVPFLLRPILEPMLQKKNLQHLFETMELPLIDVLVELESNGITIDLERLRRLSRHYAERLARLETEIHDLAGERFNIASPKQLQAVLFDKLQLHLKVKDVKQIKKTKSGFSTDIEVLELLAPLHPLAAKVIEYRQAAKLKGTYIDALPELADPVAHRIHASFNQVVTATGRLSSSDPNLQNIPIRTDEGREIRGAFVPGKTPDNSPNEKPFDTILSCDYSQIELRVLAHFTGDENLRQAFANNEDIHASVATQVYHVSADAITSEMRRTAKAVNFGIIYGQSAFGLSKQLGIEHSEAKKFIETYFEKYPSINAFLNETLDTCLNSGYVTTYSGRQRRIDGIRPFSQRKGQLNLSERTAINTVIQGSAADLMKMAMLAVFRKMQTEQFDAKMLLQIHDELVFEVRKETLKPFETMLRTEMTLGQPLSVPLAVDIVVGKDWGEAK